MTKMAALAGVAHDIAHHAASGLSFLSPHLAQALRAASEETTAIEYQPWLRFRATTDPERLGFVPTPKGQGMLVYP